VLDEFGKGMIIPMLKNKMGDINSRDNYMSITLSPVISKVSELVLLELCRLYLTTYDLQFGFKANSGCANAIICFSYNC